VEYQVPVLQRRRNRVTGFRIPDPRRVVLACRNNPMAVRTEGSLEDGTGCATVFD
jgi:hypothetical protein